MRSPCSNSNSNVTLAPGADGDRFFTKGCGPGSRTAPTASIKHIDSETAPVPTIAEVLPYMQLFAQLALVAGAFFAGYQLIMHRRERDEHAALEVLTRLQSSEFRRAFGHIWSLPLGATPQDVKEGGTEIEEAVNTVVMTFETMGVMVHNRIVPIDMVDQVIGGFLRESWRRLEPFVQARRKERETRRYAEWYQWLFEHLDRGHRRGVGAYEAFRDWRP